jgi:hypothetical protein
VWGGMALDIDVIWVRRETEYFCKHDWTGQIRLIRFDNFAFWRSPSVTEKARPCAVHLRRLEP